jgi:Holliday junction resolvase RusA-like endonuclease
MAHGYDEAWLARYNARKARDGGRTPVEPLSSPLHSSLCQMEHPAHSAREPWLRLTLPYPRSGNHLYTVAQNRKILSADGHDYHASVAALWLEQRPRDWVPLTSHLQVVHGFYPPDHRPRDIDNPVKVIHDALTKAGVWADDRQIVDCRQLWGHVAKEPYVLVLIRCVAPQHSLEVLMQL